MATLHLIINGAVWFVVLAFGAICLIALIGSRGPE